MEEIALTITWGLTRLIIPLGLGAIILALALIVTSLGRPGQTRTSVTERISVFLCALIALVGVLAFVMNGIRRDPIPLGFIAAAVALVLLLAAPALVWRSRFRVPAEGLATIGLSVVAILSGFSMGYTFVPLLLLMVWVCVQHLRAGTPRVAPARHSQSSPSP